MKYLITGDAGTGKTSVVEALAKNGYVAHSTDEVEHSTRLEDLRTGKPVDVWPERPVDWSKYSWNRQKNEIEKLLSSSDPVFLAAVVSNQMDFYHLFDKIFVLKLDKKTLKHRLLTRTNHSYGKHGGEMEKILGFHDELERKLSAIPGVIIIDASQTLNKVVDEILSHTNAKHE